MSPLHFCTKLILVAFFVQLQSTAAQNSTAELRQNSFIEWLASIWPPSTPRPPTLITTTVSTPQRECVACTCGRRNTVRRIVGGQETLSHAYPWMALLMSYGDFYCGATLINDLYVLTAAHCVRGFNQRALSVRLLEHDRKNSSVYKIDRRVASIAVHERYSIRNYDSDLALLRLSAPVPLDEQIRPVCMPTEGKDFAGELAVITGWGALSEGGSISNTLQEVEVPVLSQTECRRSNYGASRITDNMLCAGFDEGGKDSCQGDSGGPLHIRVPETLEHQLAGVVSWGEGCAKPNAPGVYTRVNRYNDWIAERTRDACTCESESMEVGGTEEPGTTTEYQTMGQMINQSQVINQSQQGRQIVNQRQLASQGMIEN